MKKLFYSLIMLIAMSVTFVACEQPTPEPEQNQQENNQGNKPGENEEENQTEVKSNCNFRAAETNLTNFGQVYLFQFATNDVELTQNGFSGTGEFFQMQVYANPQKDLFPTEKTYKAYAAKDIEGNQNFAEKEFVYGGVMQQQGNQVIIGGTLCAVVENGKNQDVFLCVGGTVEFKGNAEDGTMIANLNFVNAKDSTNSITKQYIYKGKFNIKQAQNSNAPARIIEYRK